MDLAEQKRELRKKYLRQRDNLSENEWRQKSRKLVNTVLSNEIYRSAEVIHCFVSMNERKEVNTHPLIEQMFIDNKRVVVPVTDFSNNTLHHVEIYSLEELSVNKWGVPEPDLSNLVDTEELDLVLVPMLAADRKGNRLGYGKGFYDQFLANTNAPAYGLIFEDFIADKLPVEPFDQPLNGLFCEKGLIVT